MGLIRKTLAVGTVGVVRPSSKKQRVAKATMRAAAQTAAQVAAGNRLAEQQLAADREFRYAADPGYRKLADDKKAAEQRSQRVEVVRAAEQERLKRIRSQQRPAGGSFRFWRKKDE